MTFFAAAWLGLLVPWLALAAWLWRGDAQFAWVSAKFLWGSSPARPNRSRSLRNPPPHVIAALLSMLAIILALADPRMLARRVRIGVIIDPHVSASASVEGDTILKRGVDELISDIASMGFAVDFDLFVPGHDRPMANLSELSGLRVTAASTTASIQVLFADRSARGLGTIVVSAQELDLPDSAIVYGRPAMTENVAIVRIGASIEPQSQLMLHLTHPEKQGPLTILLRGSAQMITHRIEPRADAKQATVFLDLPSLDAPWIEARVEIADPFAVDDRAFLVRSGSWARIEIAGDIPPAAERFAAVYEKHRPTSKNSQRIQFATEASGTASDSAAIIFAAATVPIEPMTVPLDWLGTTEASGANDAMADGAVEISHVAGSVPAGFEVVTRAGNRPILAIRSDPPTQIWIGFDVEAFSRTPMWVVWLNAQIDRLNTDGPPQWKHQNTDAIAMDWNGIEVDPAMDASPGIYRDGGGVIRAANLAAIRWRVGPEIQRTQLIDLLKRSQRLDSTPLARVMIVASAILLLLAGGLLALGNRE